ncbi:hypothetical protein B0H66DRAFT_641708 [Apodospora peruviana]|uniref:Uncharacterized protein n=1 Tax=Apodospora peruviana TaxID=516989 RepID=A0AAE0I1T4_9PEZI|nr:hypothetical protein B0H66DRAFT_641708 [Apodospora peruviana]
MAFSKLSLLALAVAVLSSVVSATELEADSLGKRSVLAERQTCRTVGWIPACPGEFACVPPGAICCSDGLTYVMPPRTCPDGQEALTTAGVVPTITAPPPPPPAASTTIIDYVWYTYTYTWYYWYYYYIYIDITSTQLVSTQVSSVTTLSVSATDSAAASSYFAGFTATAVFPTPTQTATPISAPPVAPSETFSSFFSASSVVIYPTGGSGNGSSNATITTGAPTSIVTAGASKVQIGSVVGSVWGVSAPMFGAAVIGVLTGFAMMVL